MRTLFPIFFATLLVLAISCQKAHFVYRPDSSVAGGATGGGGGSGGGGGGSGGATGGNSGTGGAGTGGALCPLTTQPCLGVTSTDPCDPVCQKGTCPCGQKCTYTYSGTAAQAACSQQGPNVAFEPCTVTHNGASDQYDDCAPGSICLAPVLEHQAYCFPLCHQDAECRSYADCSKRRLSLKGGLVSVCSPAHTLCGSSDSPCCNPLAASNSVCPSANPLCFLVSYDGFSGHSRTVCEYSSGGIGDASTPCVSSHDCMASLTCADEDHFCHPVCDLAKPACPSDMHCKAWGAEYGYCIAN